MTIALVFDNDDFARDLVARSALPIRPLTGPPTLIEPPGQPPCDFVLEGASLEAIIVDAHLLGKGEDSAPRSARQWHRGVEWFGKFRSKGYRTPAIVLTWTNPMSLSNRWLQRNPFVGNFCRGSCTILQLPLPVEKIETAIKRLGPMDRLSWVECNSWLLVEELAHKLRALSLMSTVDARACLGSWVRNAGTRYQPRLAEIEGIKGERDFRKALAALQSNLREEVAT